jgi:single-strand DNA-binding protein
MSELIATVLRASQHRFIGRLTRDPELRTLQSGKSVCNVRILINRPGAKRDDGQEPDGFKLELWNELALSFVDAHRKGDLCDVWGRVKSESWQDRTTGEQRTGLVVMVDSWSPVGQQQAPAPARPAAAATPAQPTAWASSADDINEDEVPF